MGHEVTIGGDRLGAGKRMKAYLHNYERSTHNMGYVWRSTMSAGTLVPFLTEVALPGDTFDINLNCEILTHPTIGPLFGTYKVQLDVFQIPIRLYQKLLHMNALNIGRDMSKVYLPQIHVPAAALDPTQPLDNQQINPSCLLSYLGIRGAGFHATTPGAPVNRTFNAIPYLAYWDIYKQYYANKQETEGAMIHHDTTAEDFVIVTPQLIHGIPSPVTLAIAPLSTPTHVQVTDQTILAVQGTGLTPQHFDPNRLTVSITNTQVSPDPLLLPATQLFTNWLIEPNTGFAIGSNPTEYAMQYQESILFNNISYTNQPTSQNFTTTPKVYRFPLENIDTMRENILAYTSSGPFTILYSTIAPYGTVLEGPSAAPASVYAKQFSQEGLALKTYNSDLFNNWMSTDWIDGPDGVGAVTAIDTSGGSFTIDELTLKRKIYDMLNRIAISGGTYDDWLDAVYTEKRNRGAENPMYLGGLIKNLIFQEVISNTATQDQPLGTLAGRGRMGNLHKGGTIIAKIDEPSYLMGIISITPNIDYSQGNKWDTNLANMNDFHKPALDQIGFQDLVTDQMAWWDTQVGPGGNVYKSAGKQPAWVNYMTNVNVVRGNFADPNNQMFMTLNRRYTPGYDPTTQTTFIQDLTTYIDPAQFNHIFADTSRDAQNFWAQIGIDMTARRKMSAKIMPNL